MYLIHFIMPRASGKMKISDREERGDIKTGDINILSFSYLNAYGFPHMQP